MKIKKSKYNDVEKIEHYLYGILDDDNVLRIINEYGQDPHLVCYKNDFNGIWGAIDELMHFQGEDVSLQEYNKLSMEWTKEYEKYTRI
jgi:hypothetical protein